MKLNTSDVWRSDRVPSANGVVSNTLQKGRKLLKLKKEIQQHLKSSRALHPLT